MLPSSPGYPLGKALLHLLLLPLLLLPCAETWQYSFTVGGLCLLLPMGKVYALSNPKWIYILAVTLFLAGSALCGGAPSMPAMIIGRVVAGIGGNGLYLGTVTLLSLNTSEQERPAYLSLKCVHPPLASNFPKGGEF
jgi:MFS family permease